MHRKGTGRPVPFLLLHDLYCFTQKAKLYLFRQRRLLLSLLHQHPAHLAGHMVDRDHDAAQTAALQIVFRFRFIKRPEIPGILCADRIGGSSHLFLIRKEPRFSEGDHAQIFR